MPPPDPATPAVIFRGAQAGDLPAIIALIADDGLGRGRDDASLPLDSSYVQAFDAMAKDANQVMLLAELKSTFITRFEQGCCHVDPSVFKALKSWFIVHVIRSDREFANFIRNHSTR